MKRSQGQLLRTGGDREERKDAKGGGGEQAVGFEP